MESVFFALVPESQRSERRFVSLFATVTTVQVTVSIQPTPAAYARVPGSVPGASMHHTCRYSALQKQDFMFFPLAFIY